MIAFPQRSSTDPWWNSHDGTSIARHNACALRGQFDVGGDRVAIGHDIVEGSLSLGPSLAAVPRGVTHAVGA